MLELLSGFEDCELLELLELIEEELSGLLPELLSGFEEFAPLEELMLTEEELSGLLLELLSGFEELAPLEELMLTEEELSGLLLKLLSGFEDCGSLEVLKESDESELSVGTSLESPPLGTLSGSAELSPPEDEYVLSPSAPLEITLPGVITILGRSVTDLQPEQSIKTDKTAAKASRLGHFVSRVDFFLKAPLEFKVLLYGKPNSGNFFLIIRPFPSNSISSFKP